MDDVKGFVKQYWPYILGAVVGVYLILRYSAGSSSSGGGDNGYGAFLQAQTAAGAQNAALQLQANTAAAENALNNKALDAQISLNLATLEVTKQKNYSDAFNNFQGTQAAMAQSIGSSTAGIIDALNRPSITAMSSAAYENAAALEAAGNVAANSFLAQGAVVASSANTAGTMAGILGGAGAMLNQPEEKTDWAGIINAGANAYSSFMTGGMMGGGSGYQGYQQRGYNAGAAWGG